METRYIRLPDGKKMECYDCIVNSTSCEIKFINQELNEVKDFLGTEVIDYVDILDSNEKILKSCDIYAKRHECIVQDTTIQEEIQRVVKEAWEEVIPPVIDEETEDVIQEEQVINHPDEIEIVYKDIPVEMITVVMDKPNIKEEIDNIKQVVGIVNPNNMSLEEFKAYHKSVIGDKCTQAIYKGCDVETSLGTKHFSYTAEDQQNVQDLFITILAAQENISLPYHADGNYCEIFTGFDIISIFSSLSFNKIYQTTYCNILNRMIENQTSINGIKDIVYGMEIVNPEDKELLDIAVSQGQHVIEKLIQKFGVAN